ncbi:putative required for meiotic nuclear division protein 1-like, partial [Homarus americanus]
MMMMLRSWWKSTVRRCPLRSCLSFTKKKSETLKRSLTSEESGEDEDKEESLIIPAKDLKDAFFCWCKLSKLAEDYHPDVGSVENTISVFNDNVMNYFWKEWQVTAYATADEYNLDKLLDGLIHQGLYTAARIAPCNLSSQQGIHSTSSGSDSGSRAQAHSGSGSNSVSSSVP